MSRVTTREDMYRKPLGARTLSKQNSVVLPPRVLQNLNVAPGAPVMFFEEGGHIFLTGEVMTAEKPVAARTPPRKLLGARKLSRNNTVVILPEIRDKLNIRAGDLVLFLGEGGRIFLAGEVLAKRIEGIK